jgi:isopenicillin-N N-acyltransferase-like protein
MTLPLIHLTGSAYDQGLQHGEALRERVRHNRDVYFERFAREVRLSREQALERARHALATITRASPSYADGMRGVAEAAGLPLDEVAALNVRYEILYYQFGANALADGCTSFAILPEASASGHLLIGENWDWIPQVRGALLRTTEPDGLETLAFTEAGIVGGKIGLNSAGLGLAINGLTTTDDDWARPVMPFHVRCYAVLRSRSFDDARQIIGGTPRACSGNFMLAQAPDRAVDLEAAPDALGVVTPTGGCVVHANHFEHPDELGVVEPPDEKLPHTYHRRRRLDALLRAGLPIGIGQIQQALRDHMEHPYSVCRHEDPAEPPEEHYLTVVSAVMDLHALELHISDGPPCVSPYDTHRIIGR